MNEGHGFHLEYRRTAPVGEDGQSSVLPEEKACRAGLKPDTTGCSQENSMDFPVGHSPVGGFSYRLKAHSVKAEDAGRRGEPEISIGRLLDIQDSSQTI